MMWSLMEALLGRVLVRDTSDQSAEISFADVRLDFFSVK